MPFTLKISDLAAHLALPHVSTDPTGTVSVTLNSEHTVHESEHVDPLVEVQRPANTGAIANELLALQVQAFLEASEDVDVDAETIEDILEVLADTDEDVETDMPSEIQVDQSEESHDDEDNSSQDTNVPAFPAAESTNESKGFCLPVIPARHVK